MRISFNLFGRKPEENEGSSPSAGAMAGHKVLILRPKQWAGIAKKWDARAEFQKARLDKAQAALDSDDVPDAVKEQAHTTMRSAVKSLATAEKCAAGAKNYAQCPKATPVKIPLNPGKGFDSSKDFSAVEITTAQEYADALLWEAINTVVKAMEEERLNLADDCEVDNPQEMSEKGQVFVNTVLSIVKLRLEKDFQEGGAQAHLEGVEEFLRESFGLVKDKFYDRFTAEAPAKLAAILREQNALFGIPDEASEIELSLAFEGIPPEIEEEMKTGELARVMAIAQGLHCLGLSEEEIAQLGGYDSLKERLGIYLYFLDSPGGDKSELQHQLFDKKLTATDAELRAIAAANPHPTTQIFKMLDEKFEGDYGRFAAAVDSYLDEVEGVSSPEEVKEKQKEFFGRPLLSDLDVAAFKAEVDRYRDLEDDKVSVFDRNSSLGTWFDFSEEAIFHFSSRLQRRIAQQMGDAYTALEEKHTALVQKEKEEIQSETSSVAEGEFSSIESDDSDFSETGAEAGLEESAEVEIACCKARLEVYEDVLTAVCEQGFTPEATPKQRRGEAEAIVSKMQAILVEGSQGDFEALLVRGKEKVVQGREEALSQAHAEAHALRLAAKESLEVALSQIATLEDELEALEVQIAENEAILLEVDIDSTEKEVRSAAARKTEEATAAISHAEAEKKELQADVAKLKEMLPSLREALKHAMQHEATIKKTSIGTKPQGFLNVAGADLKRGSVHDAAAKTFDLYDEVRSEYGEFVDELKGLEKDLMHAQEKVEIRKAALDTSRNLAAESEKALAAARASDRSVRRGRTAMIGAWESFKSDFARVQREMGILATANRLRSEADSSEIKEVKAGLREKIRGIRAELDGLYADPHFVEYLDANPEAIAATTSKQSQYERQRSRVVALKKQWAETSDLEEACAVALDDSLDLGAECVRLERAIKNLKKTERDLEKTERELKKADEDCSKLSKQARFLQEAELVQVKLSEYTSEEAKAIIEEEIDYYTAAVATYKEAMGDLRSNPRFQELAEMLPRLEHDVRIAEDSLKKFDETQQEYSEQLSALRKEKKAVSAELFKIQEQLRDLGELRRDRRIRGADREALIRDFHGLQERERELSEALEIVAEREEGVQASLDALLIEGPRFIVDETPLRSELEPAKREFSETFQPKLPSSYTREEHDEKQAKAASNRAEESTRRRVRTPLRTRRQFEEAKRKREQAEEAREEIAKQAASDPKVAALLAMLDEQKKENEALRKAVDEKGMKKHEKTQERVDVDTQAHRERMQAIYGEHGLDGYEEKPIPQRKKDAKERWGLVGTAIRTTSFFASRRERLDEVSRSLMDIRTQSERNEKDVAEVKRGLEDVQRRREELERRKASSKKRKKGKAPEAEKKPSSPAAEKKRSSPSEAKPAKSAKPKKPAKPKRRPPEA